MSGDCFSVLATLILHRFDLAGRLNSMSGHRPMFNQLWDFFPKTQIWENSCNRPDDVYSRSDRSFIRQVVHSKFRRLDICLQGPNAQASYT